MSIGASSPTSQLHPALAPLTTTSLLTHSLVLSTLDPIVKAEPDRKAFRLMGGVLVEKNVRETEGAVKEGEAGVSIERASNRGAAVATAAPLASALVVLSVMEARC